MALSEIFHPLSTQETDDQELFHRYGRTLLADPRECIGSETSFTSIHDRYVNVVAKNFLDHAKQTFVPNGIPIPGYRMTEANAALVPYLAGINLDFLADLPWSIPARQKIDVTSLSKDIHNMMGQPFLKHDSTLYTVVKNECIRRLNQLPTSPWPLANQPHFLADLPISIGTILRHSPMDIHQDMMNLIRPLSVVHFHMERLLSFYEENPCLLDKTTQHYEG
jgi:hypothetical protein